MYSNFKEHAIEFAKQAIQEDDFGNYSKAFPLYMNALEYFRTHLKYEKNLKIKEAITQKCMVYSKRLEEIRSILDNGGSGPTPGGDATVASQPKTKSKGGVRKDLDDPEQAKLGAGLDSVKWSDVAKLENAKQALQEDV